MLYCLSASRHVVPVVFVIQSSVGEWLSLVEHLVRDQGVGGSNPLSPTNYFNPVIELASLPFPRFPELGSIWVDEADPRLFPPPPERPPGLNASKLRG